jgi:hypothetical protein
MGDRAVFCAGHPDCGGRRHDLRETGTAEIYFVGDLPEKERNYEKRILSLSLVLIARAACCPQRR